MNTPVISITAPQAASKKHAVRYALARSLLLLASAVTGTAALAQGAPRDFLGVGAISLPEFQGSADRGVAPFVVGRFDFGDAGSLRLNGVSAQYNLLSAKSAWAAGPLVALRPARDDGVTDEVVKKLRKVDATAELGAFVQRGWENVAGRGDSLALGVEARGGKGTQVSLTSLYRAPRSGALQLGADARVDFADDKHMQTYFSVDADNSTRSGLPVYAAGSGAKSASLGFTGMYDLNRDWMLIGRLGYSRLLGDAKDSPIVQRRGEAGAVSLGLAVGYRF
ncbi:MAG: MipA/OmpV family protein [Curvibacter sp.]|jgi:outer membrane protein|nr:MipA/OmpV family protein [Curvibacter sp.]